MEAHTGIGEGRKHCVNETRLLLCSRCNVMHSAEKGSLEALRNISRGIEDVGRLQREADFPYRRGWKQSSVTLQPRVSKHCSATLLLGR